MPQKPKPIQQRPVAQRLSEAYEFLGVTAEAVEQVPKIEHLFNGLGGFKKVDPSELNREGQPYRRRQPEYRKAGVDADRAKLWEYISGSDDPDARKILEARSLVPAATADWVPFEAYCLAAGVATKKAFGIVAQEVADQSGKAAALLARANHPDVVSFTVEQALTAEGTAERRMLHQSQGFLPMPKSNILNVYGNAAIDQRNQSANVAVLPPVEDSVRRLHDRFGEMIIESAPPVPLALPPGEDDAGDDDEDE